MKLTNVAVTGFKPIKGTENLIIDDKVTILIGANDHGKTNLLEAVLRLNDENPILNEDKNWDLPSDKLPRIEWIFKIDNGELDELKGIITSPDVGKFPINSNQEIIYFREGARNPVKVLSVPFEISVSKRTIF